MTEPPQSDTPLDYARLIQVSYQALTAHHLTELDMVVAGKVLEMSFVIKRPFAVFEYASELAALAGLPKSKGHIVVRRLRKGGVLKVDDREVIYTFQPPTLGWPWDFELRVKDHDRERISRLEAALLQMNRNWPSQLEFFAPDADRELADALSLERMREALREAHKHAVKSRDLLFQATDRLPKPAPDSYSSLSGCEGQTRPPETGSGGGKPADPDALLDQHTEASLIQPPTPPVTEKITAVSENDTEKLSKREPGGYLKGNPTISASINVGQRPTPIIAISAAVIEKVTVDELEAELMASLVELIGPHDHPPGCECKRGMCKYGGWWRVQIREEIDKSGRRGIRRAVIDVIGDLKNRIGDMHARTLVNRGGWARDRYHRIWHQLDGTRRLRAAFEAEQATKNQTDQPTHDHHT